MALFKKLYTPHCEMHDCEMHDPHSNTLINFMGKYGNFTGENNNYSTTSAIRSIKYKKFKFGFEKFIKRLSL